MTSNVKKIKYSGLLASVVAVGVIFGIACGGGGDTGATADQSIQTILDRGNLICGVKVDTAGFGLLNPDGTRTGNDVEYCRAVSVAIFGPSGANTVEFKEATGSNRFQLLSDKEIDLLIRTTTWTSGRDLDLRADFAPITFYDGTGLMVLKSFADKNNVTSGTQLHGARVCVLDGTSTQGAISDFAKINDIDLSNSTTYIGNAELRQGFIDGTCDVWTTDTSQLAGHKYSLAQEDPPIEAVILPELLSKEPLGPVTRDNDSDFLGVVRWLVYGLITAEEEGVTQANVAARAANPPNPVVDRLLNKSTGAGGATPLREHWLRDVIAAVGNYGEIYDRTVGAIGVQRACTQNALWANKTPVDCNGDGTSTIEEGRGLIYAPPYR